MRSLVAITLAVLVLAGCATPQPQQPINEQHWSLSRTVESEIGMVSLLDPYDLAHHESDPEDWYRYDFAFANDLETGRFAAALIDRPGKVDVRLTTGPLSADEQRLAGPQAQMRLRVINYRLLLSGGDTWPSVRQPARAFAYDPRWIGFENGDYHVTITALDKQKGARHDIVFQLTPVSDMKSVQYAPGVPYLVVGEAPAVTGINAGGLKYREQCANIPPTAAWSALTSSKLPLPGSVAAIHLPTEFHTRGRRLLSAGKDASVPIVVARKPQAGTIGLYIKPDSWRPNAVAANGEVAITTRVLCTVNIRGIVPGIDAFALQIEPLPGAQDPLSPALIRKLTERFDNWIRLSGDTAWRFKSAQVQRTRNPRAMLLGIMDYLQLNAKHSESLLQQANVPLANSLIEHMTIDFAQTGD